MALSGVLTLKRAGVSTVGMVEEQSELQTYTTVAEAMGRLYGFPIYKDTSVEAILGNEKVEGIALLGGKKQEVFHLACDLVIIAGKFRPESSLMENTLMERDPSTSGPAVGMDFMTSVPNIYAAGNVLRGADMHDLCALEGKLAAQNILKRLTLNDTGTAQGFFMKAEPPIRYVVPQKLDPAGIGGGLLSKIFPWPAIQVETTIRNGVMEACSGRERIWEGSFRKLIANTRHPLPVEKFRWHRADPELGIILKIRFARGLR